MTHPLIGVGRLASMLHDGADVRVIDLRWSLETGSSIEPYRSGHIPGAVFASLDDDFSGPPSAERGRHPLPGQVEFTDAMRRLGISTNQKVVVYDGGPSTVAARGWWLLRYAGHEDVQVLDGGLASWTRHGGYVETQDVAVSVGNATAHFGAMPTVSDDEVGDVPSHGVLLDARAVERFRGEFEPVDPAAGHIPGAQNRPTTENVRPDGEFLAPDMLRFAFERRGIRPGVDVAVYCGSGVNATHEILALELGGVHAALYPGSWSAWAGQGRPVETGPGPNAHRS